MGVVLHNCIALGMEIGQLEKQKSEDFDEIYLVPGVKCSHDPCVRRSRTSVLLKSLFKTHRGFYIRPRKVKYSAMGHSFTFCWNSGDFSRSTPIQGWRRLRNIIKEILLLIESALNFSGHGRSIQPLIYLTLS